VETADLECLLLDRASKLRGLSETPRERRKQLKVLVCDGGGVRRRSVRDSKVATTRLLYRRDLCGTGLRTRLRFIKVEV
jgi:hypothetical protein